MHCGAGTFSDDQPPLLLNPELLVEVVSASTSEADRVDKLTEYTEIESVQEYWICEQERALVTRYVRGEAGWLVHFASGLDGVIRSERFGVEIPLTDVYALVEWPVPPAPGRTSEGDGDELDV